MALRTPSLRSNGAATRGLLGAQSGPYHRSQAVSLHRAKRPMTKAFPESVGDHDCQLKPTRITQSWQDTPLTGEKMRRSKRRKKARLRDRLDAAWEEQSTVLRPNGGTTLISLPTSIRLECSPHYCLQPGGAKWIGLRACVLMRRIILITMRIV